MFGFGFSEVITILVVLLVLINPKDLPRVVRAIGRTYSRITKQIDRAKTAYREFEEEVGFTGDKNITGKSSSRNRYRTRKS